MQAENLLRDGLVDDKRLAEVFGCTVRTLRSTFPTYVRVGRRYFWRIDDVAEYLEAARKQGARHDD